MNEEQTMILNTEQDNVKAYYSAYLKIPYGLINMEVDNNNSLLQQELTQICKYYDMYKRGVEFSTEGTNGDYVGANLRYKMAASLIKKEARFLFAESPDIYVKSKGDLGKVSKDAKDAITILNDLVKTVLEKNKMEDILLKAAKDCLIGKRVAGLVNFNEVDGVTISFIPSTNFMYETKAGNANVVSKFVCFIVERDSNTLSERLILKKKFELDGENVYLEEIMYDGAGRELEVLTPRQKIKLKRIPVSIFVNDGLLNEEDGESEVQELSDFEMWYSKLANLDIDAERKSMNPTKYLVDMNSNSTKGLSTSAGALWDLGSDQNLEKPFVNIGLLEPAMSYSEPLKTSLDRIKTTGYEQVDMPNITLETMQGLITSGKALKAIYWTLIVRCKEKMKMWGPQLRELIDILIEGSLAYPNCIKRYTNDSVVPVAYEIVVEQNTPLPEDELEQRTMDIMEVDSKTMSRKAYMQKWRGLSDEQVEEELQQIALERQILEDASFETKSEVNLTV